jgi:hypothetical protein
MNINFHLLSRRKICQIDGPKIGHGHNLHNAQFPAEKED